MLGAVHLISGGVAICLFFTNSLLPIFSEKINCFEDGRKKIICFTCPLVIFHFGYQNGQIKKLSALYSEKISLVLTNLEKNSLLRDKKHSLPQKSNGPPLKGY